MHTPLMQKSRYWSFEKFSILNEGYYCLLFKSGFYAMHYNVGPVAVYRGLKSQYHLNLKWLGDALSGNYRNKPILKQ